MKFDSIKEANRYTQLVLLQKAGEIKELRVHPRYKLTCGGKPILYAARGKAGKRQAYYEADFEYRLVKTDKLVVEDVKGHDTLLSKLKRALVLAEFGVDVKIL